jgi:hypothetical protein
MDEPPLPTDLELYWNQQWLDVLLEYEIQSNRSALALGWRVDRFGINVSTDLRVLLPGGPAGPSRFSPIRACCASIRAGGKPRDSSSVRASGIFSTTATTSCFCSAWCFLSAGRGNLLSS